MQATERPQESTKRWLLGGLGITITMHSGMARPAITLQDTA
jgi:hypothetical protein